MCEKTESIYFPVRTEQTRFIRNSLCLFGYFSFPFLTVFSMSDVAYLTSSFVRFFSCFHQLKHSFIVIIYN